MGKELTLSKNQRGKKLTKEMFGWDFCKITSEVAVYFNKNNDNRSSLLVLVPKKAVKEAFKRNLLRRRSKEVFRLNAKRDKSVDYLIKFSKFAEGFEISLKDFFKNV
jgi:ribonuclease P protein component